MLDWKLYTEFIFLYYFFTFSYKIQESIAFYYSPCLILNVSEYLIYTQLC